MRYARQMSAPLTGFLDTRTPADLMRPEFFRYRQNFKSLDVGKLCRGDGWAKLLDAQPDYRNADLHDQLLAIQYYYDELTPKAADSEDVVSWPNVLCDSTLKTRSNTREPVTFCKQFVAQDGSRHLLAGTQSRLYLLNQYTRNWILLGDGYGGTYDASMRVRWTMGTLNDQAVFANNSDVPVGWTVGNDVRGCAMQRVRTIDDLDTIGVERAAIAVAFGGCMFLLNLTMDGVEKHNYVVWSDLNNAFSFDPAATGSIAGMSELPSSNGENILNAAVLGDELIIYTDRGIYVCQATGQDDVFAFRKHYAADASQNYILAYPHSLVSIGNAHFYAGTDDFYTFSTYAQAPKAVDWMTLASGIIFNGGADYDKIDKTLCNVSVSGYNSETGEIWFSYPEEGEVLPSKAITLNIKTEFASTVDAGFCCFTMFKPDYSPSFRDWLLSVCACSRAELKTLGYSWTKEGDDNAFPACDSYIGSIWTNDIGSFYGIVTEDFNKAQADADSLCADLAGMTLEDLCSAGCPADSLFVGALADDYCLKQIGGCYSREDCLNPTATGTIESGDYQTATGTYNYLGYYSIIRSAPNAFKDANNKKNIDKIIWHYEAVDQVNPCAVYMKLGYSMFGRDPNLASCGITWSQEVKKYLECTDTDCVYGEYPNEGLTFSFYTTGVYLYYEMIIVNLSVQSDLESASTPAIGGASCFSAMAIQVRSDSPYIKT